MYGSKRVLTADNLGEAAPNDLWRGIPCRDLDILYFVAAKWVLPSNQIVSALWFK